MRKFDLGDILLGALLILSAVILSPIWVPFFLYFYVTKKILDFRFSRYVKSHDGAKYFCYTLRKNSEEYVKSNILPRLPADTNVIYITEKYQNLGDSSKFLEQIVWRMGAMKKGFPCIAKFSDGNLLIESINHEVYQAILRKKDADKILETIDIFFSRPT